ncbi:ATP-binding protein [Chitinophaga sp. 30R24]|uniref:ATP-binding protein n=1 Tax=Chitinophaga sp. 30R24 TaxID=3248838 RepID=UPI003B91CFA6
MEPITAIQLKQQLALQEIPLEQLDWLISQSEEKFLSEGEMLFKVGDPIVNTFFIISGKIRIAAYINGHYQEMMELNDGSISGWLPFSRIKNAMGSATCIKDTRILSCPSEKLKMGIEKHYELTEALVHIMTSRVRDTTAMQQQNEKMMALGKLSAGMAHELNNPVAAITRSSDALVENIRNTPVIFQQMAALCLTSEQAALVVEQLLRMKASRPEITLSMLELSDKVSLIEDWLNSKNISQPEIAEVLAECDEPIDKLETFSSQFPSDYLGAIFSWINSAWQAGRMVYDLQLSAKRISDLVAAVKRYTYMDQAPDKQFVDIHDGIRNTLAMMNYRLRRANIVLVEKFDEAIPKIKALPGELNQVWTNLVDNAIDAMEFNKKGVLEIATTKDRQCVYVTVTDDGPGIPEDIRSRIFEPFFTTKEMGQGSGLGLDVVVQIVQRHRGSVKLTTVPGKTTFTVAIPIEN